MNDERGVDDAIEVATERAYSTQDRINERVDHDEVPDQTLTDEAVQRADDLANLAQEAREP